MEQFPTIPPLEQPQRWPARPRSRRRHQCGAWPASAPGGLAGAAGGGGRGLCRWGAGAGAGARGALALDRALATELAYGSIRQRRLLDAWLDRLGKVPAERQPPKLRWLLHLGLYQLLLSERVPAAAAVSTTVELAKRGGLVRLAPVVNGLLRAFLRQREAGTTLPLPADPAAALGLRHSLPDWLAHDLLRWLPPEEAEAFGLASNSTPALDLRVNRLRASRDGVLEAMAGAGVTASAIDGLPMGIALSGRSGDLRQLPGYAEGHWCVQDRSAQRVAALLDPQPGERILDACAAPAARARTWRKR